MPPYVYALVAHGIIGGLDVFINHEWLARLPHRADAVPEQWLHSTRELIFALLFMSLAWYEWHGALVWWIAALCLGEVMVSACDVVIEGDTRALPTSERVLHLFLFMNLGILLALVGQALSGWHALPDGIVAVHHGWASWMLSALALGALAWSVRDALAARRPGRVAAA